MVIFLGLSVSLSVRGRGGSTLGQEAHALQIHLLPPDSKASWKNFQAIYKLLQMFDGFQI